MKWFWLTFFTFLTVLILALGVWRPDLLERATVFIGWYLAAAGGVVLLALVAAAGLVGWQLWQKSRLLSLRQKDGAFPIQRIRLKGGAILYFDPNHAVGAATVVHPQYGLIEVPPQAGWDVQLAVRLAVERTRQLEAMYPGDDVRANVHGARSAVPKLPSWRALDGEAKRKALPAPMTEPVIDVEPTVIEPAPVRTPYTVQDALLQNARTRLVMGQTAEAEIVRWDLTESPHIRVHGKSQGAGKTNLIRCVAASALRVGHHVVVCDRRRFKDWSEFDGKAELIDVRDPKRFVATAQRLAAIYQERDTLLGQHGAPNISKLSNPPQRIVVVVAEFGALCAQAAQDGVLDDVLHPLTMVLREAGAAGVHVVIEDQVVDQRWPRGISTNAEPVTGYLPQNYGAAGGYYDAHKLPSYTFHYAGAVFKSLDMRGEMTAALRGVGSGATVVGAGVRGGEGGGSTSGEQATNTPMNTVDEQATNTDGWYEWMLSEYLSEHSELLMVDERGRGVGVMALARAMAATAGGNVDNYKSIASDVAKRLRSEMRFAAGDTLRKETR